MYTGSTLFFFDQLEELPFTLQDLSAALTSAEPEPDARPHIRLDYECIEDIEIYPPGALSPRWCIRQTHKGRTQVDDLVGCESALPYPTIAAQRFIGISGFREGPAQCM